MRTTIFEEPGSVNGKSYVRSVVSNVVMAALRRHHYKISWRSSLSPRDSNSETPLGSQATSHWFGGPAGRRAEERARERVGEMYMLCVVPGDQTCSRRAAAWPHSSIVAAGIFGRKEERKTPAPCSFSGPREVRRDTTSPPLSWCRSPRWMGWDGVDRISWSGPPRAHDVLNSARALPKQVSFLGFVLSARRGIIEFLWSTLIEVHRTNPFNQYHLIIYPISGLILHLLSVVPTTLFSNPGVPPRARDTLQRRKNRLQKPAH